MRVQWIRSGDSAAVKKLLGEYAAANDEGREKSIQQLGRLPLAEAVETLMRLVRFEKSPLLTRLAGLELIRLRSEHTALVTPLLDQWLPTVSTAQRVAAAWVRDDLLLQRDPAAGVAAWSRLIESELRTLQQFPNQTRGNIVVKLVKHQVQVLQQLNRVDDALAAMQRLLAVEPDDDEAFSALLSWLVQQKAWVVIDEAAKRYQERFEHDPLLLYTLAEACQAQGNQKLADETVERARKLNDVNQPAHLIVAFKLQHRGKLVWSEEEYRLAIRVGQPGHPNTVRAQMFLGEMLHDQAQELKAAEVLKDAVAGIEAANNAGNQFDDADHNLNNARARMNYFFACHEQLQGRVAKQTEYLEKAVEADPLDADVLIGLFRLANRPADKRADLATKIQHAAEAFRNQCQQSPDDATPFNQYAWLISNTEGDYQDALRCSLRSLEIRPDTAGYLDTLGRCYYAVGDLENAIRNQSRAVELEGHSGQMRRQLEFFRAELAKKKVP